MRTYEVDLNGRELAILRAVRAGHAELLVSCWPDLAVDGRWCDHIAAARLVAGGLVEADRQVAVGQIVDAHITAAGLRALQQADIVPAA